LQSKVLPILKKLAKDKDSYVRSSAVSSLGWVGETVPDKVLPILKKLINDKYPGVRKRAKQLITRLKNKNKKDQGILT